MKVEIDNYLKGDQLSSYNKDNPFKAVIRGVTLRRKEELPFQSDDDRYELMVECSLGTFAYTANKTTLRNCVAVWGDDSDSWIDKTLNLWAVQQQVRKEQKWVIYGAPEQKSGAKPEQKAGN